MHEDAAGFFPEVLVLEVVVDEDVSGMAEMGSLIEARGWSEGCCPFLVRPLQIWTLFVFSICFQSGNNRHVLRRLRISLCWAGACREQ